MSTVHLLNDGLTACLADRMVPDPWTQEHVGTGQWEHVTCDKCLEGREAVETYKLSADGKSITCLRCHRESRNPHDVSQHYCGHCHVWHDDLWPPARKAWLSQ